MSGEVICFADDTNVFYIGDTIDVIASAMRTDLEVFFLMVKYESALCKC